MVEKQPSSCDMTAAKTAPGTPSGTTPLAAEPRERPYRFGRFYAGLQIAIGVLTLLPLAFGRVHWALDIGGIVSIALGLGLWKKQKWAFYVLNFITPLVVLAGVKALGSNLVAGLPTAIGATLTVIAVVYCHKRRAEFD